MMTGVAGVLIGWVALGAVNATPAQSKVQLYREALQLVQKSRYKQAIKRWQRLIDLFQQEQKKHPPQSREHNQQIVGQCNTLYHLATTQWQAKQRRASCLTRVRLERKRKTISPRWLKYVSDGSLPKLFLASKKQLKTACAKVPSLVVLKVKPAAAIIEYRSGPNAPWTRAQGSTIAVRTRAIALRVKAPGYKAWTKQALAVPRWGRRAVVVALKKGAVVAKAPTKRPATRAPASRRKAPVARRQPPRRAISRRPVPRVVARIIPRIEPRTRPTPPPPPFYKTWWFWTVTGVVIAGGTTAAIVAATTLSGTKITHPPDEPLQIR